ncbi:Transposase and inactivated derivatives [Mobiluncus mulieris]|nr:Transposase and inactivated derivatives [Mobiluncus mulieris]
MRAELTSHLGYEKHAAEGRGSGNSRNGTTPKTVQTEVGSIRIDQPRDRAGTFQFPVWFPPGAARLGGLEDMIYLSLCGGYDDT